jgi:starch synthase
MKVLFLSPEVVPFAKTGGLADVAGALPAALNRLGVEIRLVLPLYRTIREGGFTMDPCIEGVEVMLGQERLSANVWETSTQEDIPVYFMERDDLYDRSGLYGTATGDYVDNLERFSFFSQGALQIAEALSFGPDVIHCHDWQTGLVPALIKGPYKERPFFENAATVFTIHNLGYQGLFPKEKLPLTGLDEDDFFHAGGLEYWGKISLLKAGLLYSDAITTVSPKYAEEIQTAEYGMGMEGILRNRRASLHGILNGVDYRFWDPATDIHLPANFSPGKMAGKGRCKASLIEEMSLDPDLQERPVLGMVSRLDAQKGLDLMVEILDDLLEWEVGLVILGAGSDKIQRAIQRSAERHPGRVALKVGFDEPLAHRIMAGADVFVIPSRYEPCGLTQMYALKYGTVPLVRSTGGLDDTIAAYDPASGKGTGFKFVPYEPAAFLAAVRRARDLYGDHKAWQRLVMNCMKSDYSWDRSAEGYLGLYRSL